MTAITVPRVGRGRLGQHRLFVHRSESLLTLDITPGSILLDVEDTVQIGKAAKSAGVTVDTIRFYQKLGLIKSAGRSVGGYRLFDDEQIRDLTFVRHAQELGFSLTEIKELLALRQKIDQGPKSFGFAADNGDHQGRPSVPARTNDSGVPPTPTQIGSGFWSGRG